MMVSRCFRIWNSFLLCVTDVEKADLGMDRINELPLDDTPKKHVLPPRARRAPVNVENTEALNGYRALAETGMDDAEAMAARQLPDLGGSNVYRPTLAAGPARHLPETRRPNAANFQGMQTSQNGILMPPGSQLHRYPSTRAADELRANGQGNRVTSTTPSSARPATVGSSNARAGSTEATNMPLPPHLRAKSTQIFPVAAPNTAISAPTPTSNAAPSVKGKEKETSENIPEKPHLTDKNSSEVHWAGRCKAHAQGKEHDIVIKLKTIKSDEHPNGHAVCIILCPGVFDQAHSMNDYTLDFHKNHMCIVSFGASASGPSMRYSLKFDDSETAADFVQRADMLQKVMKYLREMAASQDEVNMGTIALVESAAPDVAPPTQTAVQATEVVPMKKDHGEEDLTDAFSNLKLTNVKGSPMYTTDRPPRVQYSPEQLLERRSSAEAPAGIKDVKIPLEKDSRSVFSKLPPHLQQNQKVRTSQPNNETAKLMDWISGTTQTQTGTGGVSQVSMPGLSEAINYHKAVATTAQFSTESQIPRKESAEGNLEKNTDSKAENKENSAAKLEITDASKTKIDIGTETQNQMQVESSIAKTSIDSTQAHGEDNSKGHVSNGTAMESTDPVDASANTDIERAHVQHASQDVLPKEPPIPPQTAESDKGDAMSDASHDSAVEFEAPVKAEPDVTAPAPTPVQSPETAPAVPFNPTGYAMPAGIPMPQMAPGQVHYATQMQPQMHPQTMIPGMYPVGVVHAVTVTYHISYPDSGAGMDMNGPVHQNGGAFSPNTEPFQPSGHGKVPRQQGNDQPRTRRGLGGSMFATGYSAAKFPGSFTGATAE
ncbi:hypothetical protein COL5a_009094 [Colletotrichum fioriniae]|nr:uncharacterized protein COL516b_012219 [Colletotrichum fioriniae]KAJ0295801.1 hypothetical protein COL516b_012219 [Colletotrichum fioriniae]KAJ0321910.1 hypothetical protein COL5a_009094 [Colletotrichum fioriniae]